MSRQILHFLLVPDGSAARRLRRVLATRSACSGIVVGTWPELMELACRTYLIPKTTDDNDSGFREALNELEDTFFWTESLSVASEETSEAVKSALIQIVTATDSPTNFNFTGKDNLPERPRKHLDELFQLAELLEGRWPRELSILQSLLMADSDDALHTVRVYHSEGISRLTRWQAKLIEKLNQDADNSEECRYEELPEILNEVLSGNFAGKPNSTLRFLQERLFEAVTDKEVKKDVDESVQWVGVRDFLQEAEVAVGMIQSILDESADIEPSEIGLLIPDSFEYARALEDTFALGGIAHSGLPSECWCRDLGREVVFHFLYCRQKPAPAMALAVCLSSPLMPWSRREGVVLAQAVMDGDYQPSMPSSENKIGDAQRKMLDLLRGSDSEPASLSKALTEFVSLLQGRKELVKHVQRAKAAVEQMTDFLENTAPIDWKGLRQIVNSRSINSGASSDFNLEGVTVWRESQESWRPVKHLIVLGFVQGHYPSALASDSVFSSGELDSILEKSGLHVFTPTEAQEDQRLRFKRQLGAVSESVTFLVPRLDSKGERQTPSDSLVFMHQLFAGIADSADERIRELDATDKQSVIQHLAEAASVYPQAPRALLSEDLIFDRDLLAQSKGAEVQLKPESPSSLETLMVSPLAWLLDRIKAKPLLWEPETVDDALLGNLAHEVFEGLFHPGEELPDSSEIKERVESLLDDAIQRLAPFLQTSQWQVEKMNFVSETCKAARAWREVLVGLNAEVLASEDWLWGFWSGIPIHGKFDLLLGLPGERLLVVDYKRSRSRYRLDRMKKGYDSQVYLYRTMLESGGFKHATDDTLLSRVHAAKRAKQIGTIYYMLKDQNSLSDSALMQSGEIPGWWTLKDDVAGEAIKLIEQRIGEVRAGEVCLNLDSDIAKIDSYALKKSPLIGLFTVSGEAEESK